MVRVRIGSTWKQDPALRTALARGGATARAAALQAVDALALEVDGIDVGAGQAEGPVLAGVEALGEGVLRLLAGSSRAQVHFSEGGVELLLGRRGSSALVTVVALGRPARVLARDVDVDLAELARATRDAADALAVDLRSLHASDAGSVTGPLTSLVERLDRARAAPVRPPSPAPPTSPYRPQQRDDVPTCTFELHHDEGLVASYQGPGADLGSLLVPGRVRMRTTGGAELATLEGPPFLLLRDLVAFAGGLADATARGETAASALLAAPGRNATVRLEADLARATLAVDGAPPRGCPPLLVARACCEAATELCATLVALNRAQENNAWLVELRNEAADRMAHVGELIAGDVEAAEPAPVRRQRLPRGLPRSPLGPGAMRRLVFRRAWIADVGSPRGTALSLADGIVVAAGASAVLGLDPGSGSERWRRPGVRCAWFHETGLFAHEGPRVVAIDAATGDERWSFADAELPDRHLRDVIRIARAMALVVTAGSATAFEPGAGRAAWTFTPPAALYLRAAAIGSLVMIGTDTGFLYAVDAPTGRTAWRLRVPGAVAAAPTVYGDSCLVLCTTDLGGSLVAVDVATGRRRFEVPLDVTPSGAPVAFGGLLAIAGMVAGDAVVSAVEPAGRLAWEDAPPLGSGGVALVAMPRGLLAKTADGTCVALDRGGETLWSRSHACRHPPPSNPRPVVARGVVMVPSHEVEVLDTLSGRLLGEAPVTAPVQLVADAALSTWGIDATGVVTAARLETHLSVV